MHIMIELNVAASVSVPYTTEMTHSTSNGTSLLSLNSNYYERCYDCCIANIFKCFLSNAICGTITYNSTAIIDEC